MVVESSLLFFFSSLDIGTFGIDTLQGFQERLNWLEPVSSLATWVFLVME